MFSLVPYRNRGVQPRSLFSDLFGPEMFETLPHLRADVYEESGNYVIEAELPGFERDEIKVDVEDDRLTISAQRNNEAKEDSDRYIRRERSYNRVCRSFVMDGLDPDKVSASYNNGVLKLVVPKPEQTERVTRQIEIK